MDQISVNTLTKTSQQHQHINTSQKYQHRNTIQQYQHKNTSQQYQHRSFQRHRTSSTPYRKYDCIGCGINNKVVREFPMQHYGTLYKFPFIGQLCIHKKTPIEKILQKNHKHGSLPKDFNNNKDTSRNKDILQDKISCPCPKVNSVRFEDPYDHINPMENNHEDTHIMDTQYQYMEHTKVEQE